MTKTKCTEPMALFLIGLWVSCFSQSALLRISPLESVNARINESTALSFSILPQGPDFPTGPQPDDPVPFHRYGLVDPPYAGGGGFIVHAHHLGVDQNRIGVPVLGHLRGNLLGMQRRVEQNEQRYGTHATQITERRLHFNF